MAKTQEEKDKELREYLDSLPESAFKEKSMKERWEEDQDGFTESIIKNFNPEE